FFKFFLDFVSSHHVQSPLWVVPNINADESSHRLNSTLPFPSFSSVFLDNCIKLMHIVYLYDLENILGKQDMFNWNFFLTKEHIRNIKNGEIEKSAVAAH
ncbi:hypothetical protein L9F63_008309, partial [Diploptera punctata]